MLRTTLIALLASLTLAAVASSPAHAQGRGGRGGGFGSALGGAVRNVTGVPELTRANLIPSAVHQGYAPLDEENPLAEGYDYMVSGMAEYDAFFRDVARVRGTLALAQNVIARADAITESGVIDQVMSGAVFTDAAGTVIDVPMAERRRVFMLAVSGNIAGARAAAGNVGDGQIESLRESILAQHADVVALAELFPVASESIAALPTDVTNLTTLAPNLVTNAPSAFAGPQAVNAPRITEELGRATATLQSVPNDIAAIATGLAALTSAE
jgi:hypothetical protein